MPTRQMGGVPFDAKEFARAAQGDRPSKQHGDYGQPSNIYAPGSTPLNQGQVQMGGFSSRTPQMG